MSRALAIYRSMAKTLGTRLRRALTLIPAMRLLSALVWTGMASAGVLSSLPAVPRGFVRVSTARPDDVLKLWVSLKHAGTEVLAQKALEIATPGHADYGKHLSSMELRDLTAAPSAEALRGVTAWLATEGVKLHDTVNDVIMIQPTVKQANALLGADFAWYKSQSDDAKLRTLSYGVPDAVSNWVRMIQPTTRFGGPVQQLHLRTSHKRDGSGWHERDYASDTAPTISPAVLRKLYNIHYTVKVSNALRPAAFGSFYGLSALKSDFQRFQDKYFNSSHQALEKTLVDGVVDNQNETGYYAAEANLDSQALLSVVHPIPIREYLTGGLGPPVNGNVFYDEPYLEILTYLLNQSTADLPQVLSVSYAEEEYKVPRDYALEVCHMFMQLGARGVSVLFSSGDSGPGGTCPVGPHNLTQLTPLFPASCPWVTAVGATNRTDPERPANFSGGGFSTLWERPPWQDAAVSRYLAKIGNLNAGSFNSSGRAYPDVAAMGMNVAFFRAGKESGGGGTSASTPLFAGVVALLNDARQSIGLPLMGHLGPWLFQNSHAFHDFTEGKAFGCWLPLDPGSVTDDDEYYPSKYWEAVKGWDAVTGLGSPDFGKLLAAAAPGVSNN